MPFKITGLQIAGAAVVIAFLTGVGAGEFHGRGVIKAKWNKAILETDTAAGKVEDTVAAIEDEQDERVDTAKTQQREEDTVSRQTYTRLERTLNNERSHFEKQLNKAKEDTSLCNCANLDMPIGLQRRGKRPPSKDK